MNLFNYKVFGRCIKQVLFNDDPGVGDDPGTGGGGGGGGDNPPAFDASIMLAKDGSLTDAFHESLPGMLGEGYEEAKIDYKDIPSLVKGIVDTKRAFHQKTDGMIKVPGEDATDEEKAAYRQALGVPDSAEAYKFERKALADGQSYDQDGEKMFKEVFHQLGIGQAQASGLVEAFDKYEEALVTKMAEAQVAADEAAKKAFSDKHGDNADKVTRLASQAMQKTGFTDKVLEHIAERYPELKNDPVILDWFHDDIIPKMLPGEIHDTDAVGGNVNGKGLRGIYTHKTSQGLKTKAV